MSFWQFFKRKPTASPSSDHEQRLAALEERWNVIENEWTEWYEKFRLLHLRLAKRQKALEAAEASADREPAADEASRMSAPIAPNGALPLAGLTDQQRDWQQKILRQRARI